MLYRKNVGPRERGVRIAAAAIMGLCAFSAFAASPLKWVFLGAGATALLTGIFGYCPACAMVGRRSLE